MIWRMMVLLGVAATMSSVAAANTPPAAPKPNIVILLCDDLGYGDLGCYGHSTIKTPHLDKMAQEGILLTQCYSAAPVCSSSRAGMITGKNPYRVGVPDWIPHDSGIFLDPKEPSLARSLKQAGYHTALIGKWHLNSRMDGTEPTPEAYGFDYWCASQNNASPSHHNPDNMVRNGSPVGLQEGYSSALLMDEAIDWIDSTKEPFFLMVTFHAPHEPVAAPEEYTSQYPLAPGDPETTKPIYYGAVAMIDAEVGRLMATLKQKGLADNTLVFFTSDNGPETLRRYKTAVHSHGSPGKLRGMKLHTYEGGYRVPGIVYWPKGIKQPGTESSQPVCNVDLLPTVCALAGVPLPANASADGTNIAPLFAGDEITRPEPLYWQYDRALNKPYTAAMLVDGQYKIVAEPSFQKVEVYDLKADPMEEHDLASTQPELTQRLTKEIAARYREINGDRPPLPPQGRNNARAKPKREAGT